MNRPDPWSDPNWVPLRREAMLTSRLLGLGVTSLGKASYADGLGHYYSAFFGLSVGLERLAKLICICHFAIKKGGQFPDAKSLKEYGHDIPKLLGAVNTILSNGIISPTPVQPEANIEKSIVECLSEFANAKKGRYNNFDTLEHGAANLQFEPVRKWWDEVAEKILTDHYYGKRREATVKEKACAEGKALGGNSMVLLFNEHGDPIQCSYDARVHTGKTETVQKYGRLYSLRVIKRLAIVHKSIFETACDSHGLIAFCGHSAFFDCYRADDKILKSRKIWPAE